MEPKHPGPTPNNTTANTSIPRLALPWRCWRARCALIWVLTRCHRRWRDREWANSSTWPPNCRSRQTKSDLGTASSNMSSCAVHRPNQHLYKQCEAMMTQKSRFLFLRMQFRDLNFKTMVQLISVLAKPKGPGNFILLKQNFLKSTAKKTWK